MTLRTLNISDAGHGQWTNRKYLKLRENNFSLKYFLVQEGSPDSSHSIFNGYEERLLDSYYERNKRVEKFTHKIPGRPGYVPRHLWPEAMAEVANANLSYRFECIKALTPELFDGYQPRNPPNQN